jgi:hypothetical protein
MLNKQHSLETDGRFREIIEDIRRLPNVPERQEVFMRFWTNLYTQEYQAPLAREGADQLPLSTAALRELEALEDEERREMGGRELVRLLTLIREDGSLVGGRDRSSPATVASVSVLDSSCNQDLRVRLHALPHPRISDVVEKTLRGSPAQMFVYLSTHI